MAVSKAATLSVLTAVLLLHFTPILPGIVFIISGIGVTLIYRAVKGCFNFINPIGLTGAGAVVLVNFFYPVPLVELITGLVISVIVGLLVP